MTRLSAKCLQAISASWPIASRCRSLTPTNAASRVSFQHISSEANQSVDTSFPENSSGDIGVFQHTPMATHINVAGTGCTGEENSRTFPQRRTSSLTIRSATFLSPLKFPWGTAVPRAFQLTVQNIIFLCRQATSRPSNEHFPSAPSASRVTCPAASSWSRRCHRGLAVHHQC